MVYPGDVVCDISNVTLSCDYRLNAAFVGIIRYFKARFGFGVFCRYGVKEKP